MQRDDLSVARRYYDNFDRRLLSDYVYGNLRMQEAIGLALRSIPKNAKSILDIGIGLGWSTQEMSRHFKEASLLGVDLSPRLIELARCLNESSKITFAVADIASEGINLASEESVIVLKPHDAIVMLDVYEHISRPRRRALHRNLKKALRKEGTVVLTFPSVMHQRFLRKYQPERIQPVDEDVTYEDVGQLARDLELRVIHYEHMSLGHVHDYVHVVLQGERRFLKASKETTKEMLQTAAERKQRVTERLGVKVMQNGLILRKGKGPKICIAAPREPAVSETFIRAHVENLPADVRFLHGGWTPLFCEGDSLLDRSALPRLWRAATRRAFRLRDDYFEKKAVAEFLKRQEIRLVLAEFGPVGTGMFEVCEEVGIPLVAHFHGADAYAHKFINGRRGRDYPRLFSSAAAIIAVSRDMQRQLRTLGAPEDKIHYNPYGVDTQVFQGAMPEQAPPVFVSAGRFVDKKAPLLTLLAFRSVAEQVPEAKLVMIGDGYLLESCRQACRAFGLEDRVSFPGALPHMEVAHAMQKARVFVQHSIRTHEGDSEGTPVAVLEAGCSGLPTVATRHGGIVDVVKHGETGFLVDEGDVAEMARRMSQLIGDPQLAQSMGHNAQQHIQANYSMEKSIRNLWKILEIQLERD